jgi:hypothetical protein
MCPDPMVEQKDLKKKTIFLSMKDSLKRKKNFSSTDFIVRNRWVATEPPLLCGQFTENWLGPETF